MYINVPTELPVPCRDRLQRGDGPKLLRRQRATTGAQAVVRIMLHDPNNIEIELIL